MCRLYFFSVKIASHGEPGYNCLEIGGLMISVPARLVCDFQLSVRVREDNKRPSAFSKTSQVSVQVHVLLRSSRQIKS